MKGVFPQAELQRVPAGVDCRDVRRLQVPLLEAQRHLVLCRCQS
jgi:16S rRNA G527 N7-methylase RsmG